MLYCKSSIMLENAGNALFLQPAIINHIWQSYATSDLRIVKIIIALLGTTIQLVKSEQLFDRAKKVLPGGVNSPVRFYDPYPFFAASARGSKMITADNKTYLDFCMGYGAM